MVGIMFSYHLSGHLRPGVLARGVRAQPELSQLQEQPQQLLSQSRSDRQARHQR